MIVEYHRPDTLDKALALLARTEPVTIPLGGGSAIDHTSLDPFEVVDLQALGLDTLQRLGNSLDIGAMVRLQKLYDWFGSQPVEKVTGKGYGKSPLGDVINRAIRHEATNNLRQVATVAGTLVASDGRSPLATVFLALDAQLTLLPEDQEIGLGNLLPLRKELLLGKLITRIKLPLNSHLAYEYVARTPADRPIVCVAVARWASGRTRVALGGYGGTPMLTVDGPDAMGVEVAARSAYSEAGDEWASAEYRQEMAFVLTQRCLKSISGDQGSGI